MFCCCCRLKNVHKYDIVVFCGFFNTIALNAVVKRDNVYVHKINKFYIKHRITTLNIYLEHSFSFICCNMWVDLFKLQIFFLSYHWMCCDCQSVFFASLPFIVICCMSLENCERSTTMPWCWSWCLTDCFSRYCKMCQPVFCKAQMQFHTTEKKIHRWI